MPPWPFKTAPDAATADAMLSALSNEQGRLVMAYFETGAAKTAPLTELAEYVAGRRDDTTLEQARLHLYHHILPKLEHVGLVEQEPDAVRYLGAPAWAEARVWSQYFAQGVPA
jgi:hypothetical protein